MKSIDEFCELIDSAWTEVLNLGSVAVMPDYFVDRFVRVHSIEELTDAIIRKSSEGGGGSIRGVKQSETKGGNAVNTAYALGKFGAYVHLLAIADSLPALSLANVFQPFSNVKLEIAKGSAGYTVAFEFLKEKRHVNVMVSETGDLEKFDGSAISEGYWQSISRCKIDCVLNWSSNQYGTELCERVFGFGRKHDSITFLDPADPLELEHKLPYLRKRVFDEGLLDILSLNENEVSIFSRAFLNTKLPSSFDNYDLEIAVKKISEMTGGTVDLHTKGISMSCTSGECTKIDCYKVEQRTITGAGDVWDAAEIIGYLANWPPEVRLHFANAAAGLYVSRETVEPPSMPEIIQFVRKMSEKDEL